MHNWKGTPDFIAVEIADQAHLFGQQDTAQGLANDL